MSLSTIHSASCPSLPITDGTTSHEILQGEIKGARIFFTTFAAPRSYYILPVTPISNRILLFYKGSGTIMQDSRVFPINEMCLFVPRPLVPFVVSPSSHFTALEIQWSLRENNTDLEDLASSFQHYPFYQPYSTARTYKEEIKSPKTTSRTLLPPYIVPRVAIGSVQTTGPDAVAKHSHPMLEQLFFSLEDNECTVECDDQSKSLAGADVLHIPLGSTHGVTVEEGKNLHYIWLDFFLEKEGARWISDMHKDVM
eukprot:TRINITY_DN8078_c0_g1_i2.p1 TRINITY_DN8078_c0_g1~~TRINITY_DN8078_c0_g1_i2.p1  ORF type:complete len:268 (-),score=30.90 TRINITY_DN8078_c0_g1_i2:12-773(-)